MGVLMLGAGGLGKSCLAGKICERFPGHMVISLQGKLDEFSLGAALKDAFRPSQDKTGQERLKEKSRQKGFFNFCIFGQNLNYDRLQ
ncbi:MAG TPA: hypothetical protein VK469_02235 [Candidatus Kapabacteria bacterium]|nr:hypothetical protein [Candidatus Kapabacteria bacterium]